MDKEIEESILACLRGQAWRWRSLGIKDSELFEADRRIKTLNDWVSECNAIAESYEKAADAIEDKLVKTSNYLSAAVYYHASQLGITRDNTEKKQIFLSSVRSYLKAAEFFAVPLERVEYPYEGKTLSAYFRNIPDTGKRPCVVLIRGADASRTAEDHIITEYLLHRGLSVFNIDVPGQYEARFDGLAMTPEFEKPVAAAFDYLETRPEIDRDKIAIMGTCVGGHIAPRAASLEKRARACVSVGGFYSLAEFEYHIVATLNLQNDMMVTAGEYAQMRKGFTLERVIDKMTCPLLVVNGARDSVMPNSQAVKIYEEARCPKDLEIYEGLGHNAWHQDRVVLANIADWIWDKLHG